MVSLKGKPVMWTLDEGRVEVAKVQEASRQFGFHVCLGGGVLNNGESRKDLDLYFLPFDNQDSAPRRDALVKFLEMLWGASTNLQDTRYNYLSFYERKLRFDEPRCIDVFIL